MNIERLKKIIEYSETHHEEMDRKIGRFYSYVGIGEDKDILNILQIARPALLKKGYFVLEIPLADREIGALCYRGDAVGYIVINTSLPRVNTNFAICHEIYHAYYTQNDIKAKAEFSGDDYLEHEEEYAANVFAGMLLMPENSFRQMFTLFERESEGRLSDTIVRLMSYYQVPYMAALIRCYELQLADASELNEELLQPDKNVIRRKFTELWLDDAILDANEKDDYNILEIVVRRMGTEYAKEGYLTERTVKKVLKNMQSLYAQLKGDAL